MGNHVSHDVNTSMDDLYRNSLMRAIRQKNVNEVGKLLEERRINLNHGEGRWRQGYRSETPLVLAVEMYKRRPSDDLLHIIKLLLEHGANPFYADAHAPPLMLAMDTSRTVPNEQLDKKTVDLLSVFFDHLQQDPKLPAFLRSNHRLVTYALMRGDREVVKFLLNHGFQWTPQQVGQVTENIQDNLELQDESQEDKSKRSALEEARLFILRHLPAYRRIRGILLGRRQRAEKLSAAKTQALTGGAAVSAKAPLTPQREQQARKQQQQVAQFLADLPDELFAEYLAGLELVTAKKSSQLMTLIKKIFRERQQKEKRSRRGSGQTQRGGAQPKDHNPAAAKQRRRQGGQGQGGS